MIQRYHKCFFTLFILGGIIVTSCSDDERKIVTPTNHTLTPIPVTLENFNDTYTELASLANSYKWGPYNVHDPSVLKVGDYYYAYSTDVAYGMEAPPGIPVRKSKDLIEWTFEGWALGSMPKQGMDFIKKNGSTPFNSLWAPFIMKAGEEYRLYYSLSSPPAKLSVIGLLTSSSPEGPWTERGLVVTSLNDNSVQTNAIDPSVIVDKSGQHWMYYGSWLDGIHLLKLNAETGLAAVQGDKGKRIAQRGFTGNSINGNIEGAEIIYNPTLDKYFLFIAYDWLSTKYNVRVARADSPEGPFYDFNGVDANTEIDHGPMIVAPYKFKNHGGWQGTAHVSVFSDGQNFFMAHQGRPGVNMHCMVLHVRNVYWTDDGWPIVSPERYAGTEQLPVAVDEITDTWERIVLGYRVVPGFEREQISPDFQNAVDMTLHANGTVNDNAGTWSYSAPWLTLTWNDGKTEKVYIQRSRDWENKDPDALIFTGLNNEGTAVWGKK